MYGPPASAHPKTCSNLDLSVQEPLFKLVHYVARNVGKQAVLIRSEMPSCYRLIEWEEVSDRFPNTESQRDGTCLQQN